MSSQPAQSGGGGSARNGTKGAAVLNDTLVARLTQWSVNHTRSETAWGDSDSVGYTNRKEAREDCTGSLTGKFDTDKKIHAEGQPSRGLPGLVAKLVLWESVRDVDSYWYFDCVLIQNFQMTVDMDTKEVVEWTIDWGADGRFYRPGQNGRPSEDNPTILDLGNGQ